jgi:hypothetical protein
MSQINRRTAEIHAFGVAADRADNGLLAYCRCLRSRLRLQRGFIDGPGHANQKRNDETRQQ